MSTLGYSGSSSLATLTSQSPVIQASPLQTNKGGNSESGSMPSTSSSLYLFTFLATLLMLLVVSFAIVLRSFILRRRFRLRLGETIALGYVLPSQLGWGEYRHLGEKPRIWDRWISTSTEPHWQDMTPLSAKLISNSTTPVEKLESDSAFQSPPSRESVRSNFLINRFRRTFWRSHDDARSPLQVSAPLQPPSPLSLSTDREEPSVVEVSVLIAMPWGHSHSSKGKERVDDEEGFPDVLLGITTAPYAVDSQTE